MTSLTGLHVTLFKLFSYKSVFLPRHAGSLYSDEVESRQSIKITSCMVSGARKIFLIGTIERAFTSRRVMSFVYYVLYSILYSKILHVICFYQRR